ncbi:hypothetical protein TGVEG_228280 [Toxoplasma gondii VEG]|uniref:Uncharacterized protein n=1 Tax=Toxoplasma gondii (strain ATCC 50861 / VEG) TaxID=432359 RepID=B9Q8F4_TOXGV|nr:hypothetical protein TGVEG_228280 [Toxoplasma gondii VEG]CEL76348.1 TPA: hypothetical protein BN1205_069060 [Toxoplasma gondii VEG]
MAAEEETKEGRRADSAVNELERHPCEEAPSFFCEIVASPDLETPRGLSALDDLLSSAPERLSLLAHVARHSQQKALRSHQAPHAVYGPGLLSNCLPHQRRVFALHQPLPPLTLLPEPYRYQTFSLNQLLDADLTQAVSSRPEARADQAPVFAELAGAQKDASSETKKVAGSLAAFLLAGPPASAVAPHRLRQLDRKASRPASQVSVSRVSESSRGLAGTNADASGQSAVSFARSLSGVSRLSGPGVHTPAPAYPAVYVHPGRLGVCPPRGAGGPRGRLPRGVPPTAFPQGQAAAQAGSFPRPAGAEDGRSSSVLAQKFATAESRRAASAVGSACSALSAPPGGPAPAGLGPGGGGAERHREVKEKKKRKEEKKGKKEKKKRRTEGE